jgi:hypothetical protein
MDRGRGVSEATIFPDKLIAEGIEDRGLCFVFPSQTAAESWALAAPGLLRPRGGGGLRAVESDRFVGWDRFKERLLSRRGSGRPSSRFARSVWAALVVSRQASSPFLRRVLGPGEPSAAFVPFVASLPPALNTIAERAGALPRDETIRDLVALRDDYASFLAAHGLFEPAWERLPEPRDEERYVLLAPELMEDYESYAVAVEAMRGVRVVRLPSIGRPPTLYRFPNAYEELRWALLSAGRLLDGGLAPEDIALTVPDIDKAAPYVERAARLAGVPAVLRSGGSLASSPYGRLLGAIAACASSGFGFDQTRDLLLDRFASWKDPDAARGLVRFGIDRHAYAPFTDKGKRVDAWERSFAACGAPERLVRFYRRLKSSTLAISSARDFASLRSAIVAFRASLLDESEWRERELRFVERAMAELESLARTEAELGAAGAVSSPFALYRRDLEDERYVPQERSAAIPVYPYRVSALLAVKAHFVLGCSQEGIAVAYSPAPFLRDDQKTALGRLDEDASVPFASAYALLGPAARFSYAVEGFEGWSLPHAFFLGEGAGRESGPPEDLEEVLARDPVAAEARAWREGGALASELLRLQSGAALDSACALSDRKAGYARARASGPARDAALRGRSDPRGLLRLSASSAREFLSCPFAWLLGRALRLEEESAGIGFFDALLAGEMAHDAIRRLFAAMAKGGPFSSARIGEYRALVDPALDAALENFATKEGPFLAPMFVSYVPLLRDRLYRLIEAESWLEGWEAGDFELALERAYPDIGVRLEGRLDRLGRSGGSRAIVDYKKRSLPRKADLVVDEGALGDLQIAAYVALCDGSGLEVERAALWSIEDAERLVVLGPGGLKSRQDYEAELEALAAALGEAARRMRSGDFSPLAGEDDSCEGCGWKAICRVRYATE